MDAGGHLMRRSRCGAAAAARGLLSPNETELGRLTGTADRRTTPQVVAAGQRLLMRGVGAVLVKLGARGCVLVERAGALTVPAFPVPRARHHRGGRLLHRGVCRRPARGHAARPAAEARLRGRGALRHAQGRAAGDAVAQRGRSPAEERGAEAAMTAPLRIGLQEWAVCARALTEGRSVLIVRKGGIHEPRGGLFRPEHDRFALLPTFLHQGPERLRAAFGGAYFAETANAVSPTRPFLVSAWGRGSPRCGRSLEDARGARHALASGTGSWSPAEIGGAPGLPRPALDVRVCALRVHRVLGAGRWPCRIGRAMPAAAAWIPLEGHGAVEPAQAGARRSPWNRRLARVRLALGAGVLGAAEQVNRSPRHRTPRRARLLLVSCRDHAPGWWRRSPFCLPPRRQHPSTLDQHAEAQSRAGSSCALSGVGPGALSTSAAPRLEAAAAASSRRASTWPGRSPIPTRCRAWR